ncbi:MAG: DUF3090 family protein [Chloroflexi bacterium]|nr:DUF3090 family protein [Chloroflexota bacterium]
MENVIELNPVDFVTIGTIGPKGQRTFHLQAGKDNRIISFTIEKEQAHALSAAIAEMLDDIDEHDNTKTEADFSQLDMALREPIEPLFRIAQMGLAYEANDNKIILVAQEFVPQADDDKDELGAVDALDEGEEDDEQAAYNLFEGGDGEPQTVRMWCTREQMRALSLHAMDTVKSGRPDAKQNGRIIFYWA